MRINLTLLVLLFFSALGAQNVEISIQNKEGEPVSFAPVYNQNSGEIFIADANGLFTYEVENNSDTLVVKAMGYGVHNFVLRSSTTSNQIITLTDDAQTIQSISINAKRINPFGFDQKSLASSSVVIDKKSLAKIHSSDINQILYTIPGVQIQQEDGFGLRPNIGMRGTGTERSSKVTLMEDGVLIAPAPYAASAAYYFPSLSHIENIEVIKGSSQIAYGPQTNGGAINLISDNISQVFNTKINASYGSYGTRKIQGSVSDTKAKIGYLLKGTYQDSDGFKELPNNGNTGFYRGDYLAKLSYTTSKNARIPQSILLKYSYTDEKSNETYLGITNEDFQENPLMRYRASELDNIQSTHSQIMLDYNIEPFENALISTQVYLNQFSRNWFKLDKVSANGEDYAGISSILADSDAFSDEFLLMKGISQNENHRLSLKNNNRAYTSKGVQSNFFYKLEGDKVSHYLKAGIRLHADEMDRFQWIDKYSFEDNSLALSEAGIPGTESNRIESAQATSLFAQYKLKFSKLSVEPGIRFEYIDFNRTDYGKSDTERLGNDVSIQENNNTVLLPGVNIQYNIKNRNYVFAGVHKGFSPSNYKAETMPESSWNIEAGGKGISGGLAYELIFFSNSYQNLLGSDLAATGGLGSTELYNGGQASVWGIESMVSYNLLRGFSDQFILPLSASYTFTNAQFKNEFESTGPWGKVSINDFFPYVAKHQFSMQLSLEQKRFMINGMFKLVSPRYISPSQESFNTDNSIPLFHQIDIIANYRVYKKSKVFVKVNNLTNHIQRIAFHPAGWRPNMPIFVEAGIELNF